MSRRASQRHRGDASVVYIEHVLSEHVISKQVFRLKICAMDDSIFELVFKVIEIVDMAQGREIVVITQFDKADLGVETEFSEKTIQNLVTCGRIQHDAEIDPAFAKARVVISDMSDVFQYLIE
jgi:hypothetical protein